MPITRSYTVTLTLHDKQIASIDIDALNKTEVLIIGRQIATTISNVLTIHLRNMNGNNSHSLVKEQKIKVGVKSYPQSK